MHLTGIVAGDSSNERARSRNSMWAIADEIRDHVLETDHTVHPRTLLDQFVRYIGKHRFDQSRRRFFLPARIDGYIAHVVVAVPLPPRPHVRPL